MKKKVLGKKLFAVLLVLAILIGGLTACRAGNKYKVDGGNIMYNDKGKIFWCDRSVTNAEIPEQLPDKNGKDIPIVGIGANAFNRCTALESITIPGTVTSIEDKAFHGCSALTEVNFEGSEADWTAMTGEMTDENDNAPLLAATINFGK